MPSTLPSTGTYRLAMCPAALWGLPLPISPWASLDVSLQPVSSETGFEAWPPGSGACELSCLSKLQQSGGLAGHPPNPGSGFCAPAKEAHCPHFSCPVTPALRLGSRASFSLLHTQLCFNEHYLNCIISLSALNCMGPSQGPELCTFGPGPRLGREQTSETCLLSE